MENWWAGLSFLNQGLFAVAFFFSVICLWQFVGIAGDLDDVEGDFPVLSIRSLVACGTLFGWASALYLQAGTGTEEAILWGAVWGVGGLVATGYFLKSVQRLSESGNPDIESCVGAECEVYIDISEGGSGQVRVMEDGVVTFLAAQGKDGVAIAANSKVRVVRAVDPITVEVERR